MERFAASEIAKHRLNRNLAKGLYYFRDQQGLDVDFVVEEGNRRLTVLEAKANRTPVPAMGKQMAVLAKSARSYQTRAFLVHTGRDLDPRGSALLPGVRTVSVDRLHQIL